MVDIAGNRTRVLERSITAFIHMLDLIFWCFGYSVLKQANIHWYPNPSTVLIRGRLRVYSESQNADHVFALIQYDHHEKTAALGSNCKFFFCVYKYNRLLTRPTIILGMQTVHQPNKSKPCLARTKMDAAKRHLMLLLHMADKLLLFTLWNLWIYQFNAFFLGLFGF